MLASAIPLTAVAWFGFRMLNTPSDAPVPDQSAPTIALASTPAPRPSQTITFEQGCLTSRCHDDIRAAAVRHPATDAGDCDECHLPDAGHHTYPLLRDSVDTCIACHDTREQAPMRHDAMTDDACLACHNPHAGPTHHLLRKGTVRDTCAQCHPRSEGVIQHEPYAGDRCELCHDSHGADGPGLLRASSIAENCRQCHPAEVHSDESARHSHAKVQGACLGCHEPHAAPARALLRAPSAESCLGCHEEVLNQITSATVSHDAVLKGEQCVRCHDPHGTDRIGMLRAEQADVCLSCHGKQLTAADGRSIPAMSNPSPGARAHEVAGHQDCAGCHSIHGANHARLLREVSEQVPLGPYDARNYALCFSCHDSRLANFSSATQFRDGDRNLHELHLQRGDKSRGCSACHSVHAVGQPRLIAATVNFEGSGWEMPIGFELTADGGRCGAGCHAPQQYSRGLTTTPIPVPAEGGAP